MYTIDGEIIEAIDEIKDETNLVIVSNDKLIFKGLINSKDSLNNKELRFENSKDIKKKLETFNKEWANQKYLEWIERIIDKCGVENMQLALSKHANNHYMTNNSEYRKNFIKKLGP